MLKFDRESRIKQIKACGESIIEMADEIVHKYPYPMGTEITITIDPNRLPIITVKNEFISKHMLEKCDE